MRDTRYTVRCINLGALEWGAPEGLPTLLVHGWLDHAGSWAPVARLLDGWRVAVDWRGHGRSDWTPEGTTYHFPEYVADLDALVDLLGGRVNLVGHSMGGTVATLYAGVRPDRVARLVVVDGLGVADAGDEALRRMTWYLDGVRRPRGTRTMPDLAAATARLVEVHPYLPAEEAMRLAERGTRAVEGGLAWAWDPRHLLRSATPYRQDQHVQFLHALRCPVLSLHPERSPFTTADVTRLEAAIPDLRVVNLPFGGHMPHLEDPPAVASEIAAFLR